jgi:cytochrome c553
MAYSARDAETELYQTHTRMGTPMTISTSDAALHAAAPGIARKIAAFAVLTGLLIFVSSSLHAAGNVITGKAKARSCQVCHGKGGKSTNESYPVLAGQHAAYIRKQLHAFKDGTRKDPIMNGMAAPLSDKDIEDVAAYFNSNK